MKYLLTALACALLTACASILDAGIDPTSDDAPLARRQVDPDDPPPSFRPIPGLPPEIGQPY